MEQFLIYRWDWDDLRVLFVTGGAMRKILWITEDAFLTNDASFDIEALTNCEYMAVLQAHSTATSGEEQSLLFWKPVVSSPQPAGACNIFWRAITTRNSVKLKIGFGGFLGQTETSGLVLSQFWGGSPSLKYLEFMLAGFREEHCRALATLERTDLSIVFRDCVFEPQGGQGAFIQWLWNTQDDFTDEEMYQNSNLPRIEMNHNYFEVQGQVVKRADPVNLERNYFEVQRQAVKRPDLSIRAQLPGRALHVVQYNPDLVFRFLCENVPSFARSEDDDENDDVGDVGDDADTPVEPSANDPTVIWTEAKVSALMVFCVYTTNNWCVPYKEACV